MVNSKQLYSRLLVIIFLSVEFFIYITFLFFDLIDYKNYILVNQIKYSGVVLCLLFEILYYQKNDNQKLVQVKLLKLAMFFTVCADLFLLFTDLSEFGVLSFLFTQFFYMLKLYYEKSIGNRGEVKNSIIGSILNRQRVQLSIRKIIIRNLMSSYALIIVNTILLSVVLSMNDMKIDFLFIITSVYFQSLIINVVLACKSALKKEYKGAIVFALGMILFLFCDINVGIYNMTEYLTFEGLGFKVLYELSSIAMWFFYLPSQVFIAISSVNKSEFIT